MSYDRSRSQDKKLGLGREGVSMWLCNGWLVPVGMSWNEFVEFRKSMGLDCSPRKALFQEEIEDKYAEDTEI